MKKTWRKLQDKGGFISVEVMVVAMILIGFGVFALVSFSNASVTAIDHAMDEGPYKFYFVLDQLQYDGKIPGEAFPEK